MSSISENVEDRLSMLPEDILSKILSLMPTKFAVRTSLLSKRWRYTWTSVTNLDFDYTWRDPCKENNISEFVDGNEESFIKIMDRSSISSWIDDAVKLNVRELDVCVIQSELPLSVFTCNTLTNLRLELKAGDNINGWEFPSTIHLPCLKTLDIVGCRNHFSIHGCPVLESLSLEVACLDDEDLILNIPTLKRLKLLCRSAYSDENNRIILRVPILEYLFVDGVLCSPFEMEDVTSLVGVSITCWRSSSEFLWVDTLNKIRGVQNLSIFNFPFTSPLPVFPNMKQLELTYIWEPGQIFQFLESCPELKSLCIDSVWWMDFQKPKPPACMLTNLTTFKFSKCEGGTSDIGFLEYMLGNALVLKAVTVFALENLLIEDDPWFCAQVLKIPRASQHCEIHFRPWDLPSPLVMG
ncbi:putative F-box domain, FBD domain, leucine-rich repeat domain superfamily [Helianthus debilis subsp. tardiflorus]